ncbi:MAG: 30S ribosomal protein S15 [Nitrososphaera sp.]
MARIHVHARGKSHSTRPTSKSRPGWVTQSAEQVTSLIVSMANDGVSPSMIGLKLRDEHSVPLVKPVTGKSISEILAENNISYPMPEDLDKLVQKAVGLQRHLKAHNSDHRNVRSMELVEAKIHRLSKYYKRTGKLAQNWKYSTVVAQLE